MAAFGLVFGRELFKFANPSAAAFYAVARAAFESSQCVGWQSSSAIRVK